MREGGDAGSICGAAERDSCTLRSFTAAAIMREGCRPLDNQDEEPELDRYSIERRGQAHPCLVCFKMAPTKRRARLCCPQGEQTRPSAPDPVPAPEPVSPGATTVPMSSSPEELRSPKNEEGELDEAPEIDRYSVEQRGKEHPCPVCGTMAATKRRARLCCAGSEPRPAQAPLTAHSHAREVPEAKAPQLVLQREFSEDWAADPMSPVPNEGCRGFLPHFVVKTIGVTSSRRPSVSLSLSLGPAMLPRPQDEPVPDVSPSSSGSPEPDLELEPSWDAECPDNLSAEDSFESRVQKVSYQAPLVIPEPAEPYSDSDFDVEEERSPLFQHTDASPSSLSEMDGMEEHRMALPLTSTWRPLTWRSYSPKAADVCLGLRGMTLLEPKHEPPQPERRTQGFQTPIQPGQAAFRKRSAAPLQLGSRG